MFFEVITTFFKELLSDNKAVTNIIKLILISQPLNNNITVDVVEAIMELEAKIKSPC